MHTHSPPILDILKGFYTTLVVNIISWNKAYAIFPQPSFLYHKTYLLTPMTDWYGGMLAKYDKRGWRSQGILWPEDKASHASITQPRRLGDRFTWTIPLDTADVRRSERPDSVIEFSTFSLSEMEQDQSNLGYYKIRVKMFEALTLKYDYIFDDQGLWPSFWRYFAGERWTQLSLTELWKTNPAKRSQELDHIMLNKSQWESLYTKGWELERGGIELAKYDDEIPRWYSVWEEQQASEAQSAVEIEGLLPMHD